VASLIGLLVRLTKLGWFDDPRHREIVAEVRRRRRRRRRKKVSK